MGFRYGKGGVLLREVTEMENSILRLQILNQIKVVSRTDFKLSSIEVMFLFSRFKKCNLNVTKMSGKFQSTFAY